MEDLNILITVITSISVVIINNIIIKKRDTKKNKEEIYKKVFAPIISDIYSYYEIETGWAQGKDIKHFIDTREIFNRVKLHIHKNIEYLPMTLVNEYQKMMSYEYIEDHTGFFAEQENLRFLCNLLDHIYLINSDLDLFDDKGKINLEKYILLYNLWLAVSELHNRKPQDVKLLLQMDFYFDNSKLNNKNTNTIRSILKRPIFENKEEQIQRFVREELVAPSTGIETDEDTDQMFIELFEDLKSAEETYLPFARHPKDLNGVHVNTFSEQLHLRESILGDLYFELLSGDKTIITKEDHYINRDWLFAHEILLKRGLIDIKISRGNVIRTLTNLGIEFVEKEYKS